MWRGRKTNCLAVQTGKKNFVQKMKLIIEIKKTFFNKLDVVATREVADRQTA